MKNIIKITAIILLVLSGCIIKSLHPFYTEKDLVYNEEINGVYLDQDSLTWKIEPYYSSEFLSNDSADGSYIVSYTDAEGDSGIFRMHLFLLDGKMYMDFFPGKVELNSPDLFNFHLIGAHSLARVELQNQTLRLKWYSDAWLNDLLKSKKLKLDHQIIEESSEYTSYLITASTAELQKFIIKFGDDPQAFKDVWDNKTTDREKDAFVMTLKRSNN